MRIAFLLIGALVASSVPSSAQLPGHPVIATSKAGPCRMTVQGGPSSFIIITTGLEPGEKLQLTSDSEGEVGRWESSADGEGRLAQVIIPLVVGKSFGSARFEVVGKRCRIEVSYPWREE